MASRIIETTVCDRCQKVMGQTVVAPGADGATRSAAKTRLVIQRVTTTAEGSLSTEVVVDFPDLCKVCHPAVENLVDRIRLAPADKTEADPATPTVAQTEPPRGEATGDAPKTKGRRADKPKADAPAPDKATGANPATATSESASSAPASAAPPNPASPAAPAAPSAPPAPPVNGVAVAASVADPFGPAQPEDPNSPF